MSKKIAFFDFDGTITNNDSLLEFIRSVVGDCKFVLGILALSPVLIAYKLKLIPNYKAKEKMLSWFFLGYDESHFKCISKEYSLKHIDKIVRAKAVERLAWHKSEGHKIVVVSASIEDWLRDWCKKNNFDLIATRLEIKSGRISGRLATKNCYGQEKVNRINQKYNLNEFEFIYAYGDSRGDREMLSLANERYYKPFR